MITLKDIKDVKIDDLSKKEQIDFLLSRNNKTLKNVANDIGATSSLVCTVIKECSYGIKQTPGKKKGDVVKYFKKKYGVEL